MVTYGHTGRLGNVLFAAATAYAYSLEHGLGFHPLSETHDQFWFPVYLEWLRNKSFNPNLPKVNIFEKRHCFDELPFEESWRDKNIVLNGYFQTEKYFAKYRDEIIHAFNFNRYFRKEGYTSIFVRRGDYLKHSAAHPPVGLDYLKSAMDYITDKAGKQKFIVASDGMDWCKEFIPKLGYDVEYSGGLPFDLELRLLASTDHQIGSNSTFSWWAAWMNQNPHKICIAPKVWFGHKNRHLDTSDICPESWIRL